MTKRAETASKASRSSLREEKTVLDPTESPAGLPDAASAQTPVPESDKASSQAPARTPSNASTQAANNQSGTVYGYARVSSRDQNLDRQLDALRDFPVADGNIFRDKASGKDFDRPGYRRLLRRLRQGDVLVIKSIDRLGRNYSEILDEWRELTQHKRVAIVVLDMPLLDTRTSRGDVTDMFLADMILQLLSYVSQVERENTKQRQAEGIAAARARGVRFGRPRIEQPKRYPELRDAYWDGEITRREAADQLGVCVRTFDSWLKRDAALREEHRRR